MKTKSTKLYILVAGLFLAIVGTGLSQPCITLTNQPQNQTPCFGTAVTFTVGATGTEPLSYQWQQSFDGATFADRPEATNSSLVITNVQGTDTGTYRVIVRNVDCMVTSQVATLYTVLSGPTIASQPTNWPSVSCGVNLTNRVIAGATLPTYQWRLNGGPLPGETKSTINLTNVQAVQSGSYDVVIANACGSITSRVVTLVADPTYTQITTGPLVTDTAGGWHACWIDYDGDGNLDLTLSHGGGLGYISVFHNEGNGTFRKDTTSLIARVSMTSYGHFWADYDNDGNVDLFATDFAGNDLLFHNNGNGSFTRITGRHPTLDAVASAPAAWGDYDRDGFLDLYVGTDGVYPGAVDILYRGNGDGTFRRMTSAEAGPILDARSYNDNVWWVDVDNDGWPELYRNSAVPSSPSSDWWQNTINEMFRLDKDGKFQPVDIGEMARGGEGFSSIMWVDYDNDGLPDAVVGTARGSLQLFRNLGGMAFTNVSSTAFPTPRTGCNPWNAVDYDNDGWQDFIVYDATNYVSTLFRNNADGTFTPQGVGGPTSPSFAVELTWGDYDLDGFLDILGVRGPGIPNLLWHHNGNANHWLKVKLDGRASNRSGIGAKVRVLATIGGRTFWQMREISGQGPGLDNGLIAHFGLGDATNVTTLRVEWPSGIVQELTNVAANQFLTNVVESQGFGGAAPQFSGVTNGAGGLQLSFTEPAVNARYILEASSDLVNWTKLMARTSVGVTTNYTDTRATNYTRRFYRLQVP